MIVHTLVATVILPEIAIVDGVGRFSTFPELSTQITPNVCSTHTNLWEMVTAESIIAGILNIFFVVRVVSVFALNGDWDILIYLDPFVLPSAVTISPAPVTTSNISVIHTV